MIKNTIKTCYFRRLRIAQLSILIGIPFGYTDFLGFRTLEGDMALADNQVFRVGPLAVVGSKILIGHDDMGTLIGHDGE